MAGNRPSDWHVLDLDKDPTPGDPDRVRHLSKHLLDFADDVGDALRLIKGMADEEAVLQWAGMTEESWEEAKRRYPVGSTARGRVKDRFDFGVFLELEDAPEVHGFIDLLSYNPDGTINDPDAPPVPLPEVGDVVEGVVAVHVDRDRQIRIRVGRPYGES